MTAATSTVHAAPLRLLFLSATLLLGVLFFPGITRVGATGSSIYTSTGIANGTSEARIEYRGSTASPADKLGDVIVFTVSAETGSSAAPVFANGLSTMFVPLGGAPCDGEADSAPLVGNATKCFAQVSAFSSKAGGVTYVVANVSNQASATTGSITFYQARAMAGALRRGTLPSEVIVENTGAVASTVVIDFYSSSGQFYPEARRFAASVPPGGQTGLQLPVELPTDFAGIAVIGSDQEVAVTSFLIRFSGASRAIALQNGFPFRPLLTGQIITLPYVSNQLESMYSTDVTLVNTGATVACAALSYAFVPGAGAVGAAGRAPFVDPGPAGSGCSTGYPIPVSGQIRFNPNGSQGGRAFPTETRNALMAVTVTITNGSASAQVEAYTTAGAIKSAGYEGFLFSASGPGAPPPDLGTNITLPLGLKTPDGYYTQYLFSNPGTNVADVTLVYTGTTGTHTVKISIPAGGVANHSVYSDSIVPIGFVGAASVTSNVPIAAVLFRAKKVNPDSEIDENLYTAVNGVPSANAARNLFFPSLLRRVGKDGNHDGRNSWISVSVPGGGVANVTFRMVGLCLATENQTVYTTTRAISGSFVYYLNADADNGFGQNPACFSGSGTITSDVPVVAVASYISDLWSGDGEALHNAITR